MPVWGVQRQASTDVRSWGLPTAAVVDHEAAAALAAAATASRSTLSGRNTTFVRSAAAAKKKASSLRGSSLRLCSKHPNEEVHAERAYLSDGAGDIGWRKAARKELQEVGWPQQIQRSLPSHAAARFHQALASPRLVDPSRAGKRERGDRRPGSSPAAHGFRRELHLHTAQMRFEAHRHAAHQIAAGSIGDRIWTVVGCTSPPCREPLSRPPSVHWSPVMSIHQGAVSS